MTRVNGVLFRIQTSLNGSLTSVSFELPQPTKRLFGRDDGGDGRSTGREGFLNDLQLYRRIVSVGKQASREKISPPSKAITYT